MSTPRPICNHCKGTKVILDTTYDRTGEEVRCPVCKGLGFQLPPATELLKEVDRLTAENAQLREERDAAKKYAERLRGAINGSGPRDVDYMIALEKEVAELRKDGTKVIHELIQSQLHFDYCRAEYSASKTIELAHAVSEASCRKDDATEAAEKLLAAIANLEHY